MSVEAIRIPKIPEKMERIPLRIPLDSIGFHRTAKKLLKAPLGFLSTLLILSTLLGVPFRILDLWVPKDSKGDCKRTV